MDAYEPRIGGRYTSMLMGIIGPSCASVKESEFLESLETWEVLIRRYEEQSKETVNDPTRCAVVMKHAPAGIRLALRTASSSIDSNYAKLKRCVKDYLQTGLNYDQQGTSVPAKDVGGPAPMDVGAIQKGDSKGKWSKGKDKGGKGKKGKKGKEKGVMKASGKARRFDGYCSYCEKYGHKKADCRQKARDQQGAGKGKGSTNAVEATGGGSSSSTHPPSTTAAVFYKLECKEEIDYGDEVEEKTTWEVKPVPQGRREESKARSWADWSEEERWVSGVEKDDPSMAAAVELRQTDFIMYDTGSDEHVCMEEFAGWSAERSSTVKLNAVSGDQLTLIGEKKIVLGIEGFNSKVNMQGIFQVARNAKKNILSAGEGVQGWVQDWNRPSRKIIPLPPRCSGVHASLHARQQFLPQVGGCPRSSHQSRRSPGHRGSS